MTGKSLSLAEPAVWNAVADDYAADLLPVFAAFAADALTLAAPGRDAAVLDVACGPGTLALLAAGMVGRVDAVDFSAQMVGILRRRAEAEGMGNVHARTADGQRLPFGTGEFDAAFSMFGLIFFPDRAAGFAELHRVLKPGGRAVVAGWAPLDEVPVMAELFQVMGEQLPEVPFGKAPMPLSNPAEFRAEMAGAGFSQVEIRTSSHSFEASSVEEFWAVQQRSSVAMIALRSSTEPAAWTRVGEAVVARLRHRFGSGPVPMTWKARLGTGVR